MPIPGDLFEIITVDGAITGEFSDYDLPPLDAGHIWDVIYGTNAVLLEILQEGDFDLDLDVDGGDFLMWQRGELPDPLSSTDLALWQTYFGDGGSSVASASATVPEPGSIMLLLAAFACSLPWRRRT